MLPEMVTARCKTCDYTTEIPIAYADLNLVCLNGCGILAIRQSKDGAIDHPTPKTIVNPTRVKPRRISEIPELLAEFDFTKNQLRPEDISESNWRKQIYWLCQKCVNSWSDTPRSRVRGEGCLKCRSIVIQYPEIASEYCRDLNPIPPEKVLPNSRIYAQWRCKSGHLWKAHVFHRTNGYGCPACGKNKWRKGKKSGVEL